jgi:opacity protein-like surface antigen
MKQKISIFVLAFFCFGPAVARAQYYYYPGPPPPMYGPPPGYYDGGPSFSFPPGTGPYFRFGGGPSFYFDGTLKRYGVVAPVVQNARVTYSTGFALDFGMGYAFNKYVSVGFDTGYLETWINSVNSPGFSTGNAYVSNIPFMAEATFSYPIPHTIIIPYLRLAGGGSSSQFWANGSGFGSGTPINGTVVGSAWDTVFAYSATAGVRFRVSRNFSVAVGYNYFSTADTRYTYFDGFGNSIDVDFKGVQANTALVTLQWNF